MNSCSHFWVKTNTTQKKAPKEICLHCKTPRPEPVQITLTDVTIGKGPLFETENNEISSGIGSEFSTELSGGELSGGELSGGRMPEHHTNGLDKRWYKDKTGAYFINNNGDKQYVAPDIILNEFIKDILDSVISKHNNNL